MYWPVALPACEHLRLQACAPATCKDKMWISKLCHGRGKKPLHCCNPERTRMLICCMRRFSSKIPLPSCDGLKIKRGFIWGIFAWFCGSFERSEKIGYQEVPITGWWWLEPRNFMTFHSVGNFIIPTHFHSIIFQRGWLNHQSVDHQITAKSLMNRYQDLLTTY